MRLGLLSLLALSVLFSILILFPSKVPKTHVPTADKILHSTSTNDTVPMSPQIIQQKTPVREIMTKDVVIWKPATATVFWVGEAATGDNGFIHNRSSAWDVEWETHYGGYDDPDCRAGFLPCGFTPKENPFYVALPYNDISVDGSHKIDSRIPKGSRVQWKSDLKNRWIAVKVGERVCYGQWQDVGPFGEDDIDYVFGTAQIPLNTQGMKAGIDLSPAMRDCLEVNGLSEVSWRHVEEKDVPHGPWRGIITQR